MKNYQKILAGVMALSLALSVCACDFGGGSDRRRGGGRSSGGDSKHYFGDETTEETTEEPTTTTTEEPTTTTTEATTTATTAGTTSTFWSSGDDYEIPETFSYFTEMVDVDIDSAVEAWIYYFGSNIVLQYNDSYSSYDSYRYDVDVYIEGVHFNYVTFFVHPDGGDVFEVSLGIMLDSEEEMLDNYHELIRLLGDEYGLPENSSYEDSSCEYIVYEIDGYLPEAGYYGINDTSYYCIWYAFRSPTYVYNTDG